MSQEFDGILASSLAGMGPVTMNEDWGDDADFRKQACEEESGSKLHALQSFAPTPETTSPQRSSGQNERHGISC
jgi:hypothetical protein